MHIGYDWNVQPLNGLSGLSRLVNKFIFNEKY